MEHIDQFVDWMVKNPELFENEYPEIFKEITERIQDYPDYITASIIQKLPKSFIKWKAEAKEYFGISKQKKVQESIEMLQLILAPGYHDSEIINQAIESVKDELNEQLEYWENEQTKLKTVDIPEFNERLLSIFNDVSKYKKIMNILADKSLIEANTELWKDEGKGSKSYLAALIKNLHLKKYYKNDKRPSEIQIQAICKNTFGYEISIATIKHAKVDGFDFLFIPYASTLE